MLKEYLIRLKIAERKHQPKNGPINKYFRFSKINLLAYCSLTSISCFFVLPHSIALLITACVFFTAYISGYMTKLWYYVILRNGEKTIFKAYDKGQHVESMAYFYFFKSQEFYLHNIIAMKSMTTTLTITIVNTFLIPLLAFTPTLIVSIILLFCLIYSIYKSLGQKKIAMENYRLDEWMNKISVFTGEPLKSNNRYNVYIAREEKTKLKKISSVINGTQTTEPKAKTRL